MKKVLFATTALVATTGVAAADIALSGGAEMGVAGGSNTASQFIQDIDVTFTMTGTADNGLSFGAAIDLDETWQGDDNPTDCSSSSGIDNSNAAMACDFDDGGIEVFISGDFGRLGLGDTDSAFDWALDEANTALDAGSLQDDHTGHAGYNGSYRDGYGDGQILRYNHAIGDFSFAVSYQQDAAATGIVPNVGAADGAWAIGARYNADLGGVALTFGAAYWTADYNTTTDEELLGVSIAAVFEGGFEATIVYSDWNDIGGAAGNDNHHLGIGVGYTFDAVTVHANYGEFDSGAAGYGLAAKYDFGGGLSAHLGYGHSDNVAAPDTHSWSFGLNMSF